MLQASANCIRLPVNWGFPDGHGPPNNENNTVGVGTEACAAYVLAVNGKFVSQFGKPHQPFLCARNNPLPLTLDPQYAYWRPPLPGQVLPPIATVPSTAPATP
jgi:hypothetical protein